MTDVKLTFRWNGDEGHPSKADVQKLADMGGIVALDFLRDVAFEAERLYSQAVSEGWLWKGETKRAKP